MLFGDFFKGLYIARDSIHMGKEQAFGVGANRPFHRFRICVAGLSVNIRENGCAAFPKNGIGGGHVRKRGGNNLARTA